MKKVAIYLLIFIAGGLLLPSLWHNSASKRIGITEADGTKHYVPDIIAEKKDCEAFRAWRDSLTKPGFVPINVACPWAPNPRGVGKFVLNGVELHIPREYLWQGADDPDGPAKDNELYLMVSYPSMQPASVDGDQTNNLKITLIGSVGGGETNLLGKKVYITGSQSAYLGQAFFLRKPSSGDMPIFISHVKSIGLDYYEVPSTGYEKDIFLNGDNIKPDEWIVCFNSRCNTTLALYGKISLNLSYRRFPHLENQEKIRNAVIKLIASFVQTKGE